MLISEVGKRSQLAASAGHCLLTSYSGNTMVDCLTSPLVPDHCLAKTLQAEQHDSVQKPLFCTELILLIEHRKGAHSQLSLSSKLPEQKQLLFTFHSGDHLPSSPSSCPSALARGIASNIPLAGNTTRDLSSGSCPRSLYDCKRCLRWTRRWTVHGVQNLLSL